MKMDHRLYSFMKACGGDCSHFDNPEPVDVPGVDAVVAEIEDTFSGMMAVRRVIDMNLGRNENPWNTFRRMDDHGLFSEDDDEFRMLPRLSDFWWKSDMNKVKKVCFQDGMICGFATGNGCRDNWYDIRSNILYHPPVKGVEFGPVNPFERTLEKIVVPDYLYQSSDYIIRHLDTMRFPERALLASLTPDTNIVRRLANDTDPRVRASAAGNPILPIDVKKFLSKDHDVSVRRAMAMNLLGHSYNQQFGNDMYDIVRNVISDRDPIVRLNAVRSSRVPAEFLERNAAHDIRDVRIGIAYSRFTEMHVFDWMQEDKDPVVRATLANNPMVPAYVTMKLSHDENRSVRASVAYASNSRDILSGMLDDPDESIRAFAAMKLVS